MHAKVSGLFSLLFLFGGGGGIVVVGRAKGEHKKGLSLGCIMWPEGPVGTWQSLFLRQYGDRRGQ